MLKRTHLEFFLDHWLKVKYLITVESWRQSRRKGFGESVAPEQKKEDVATPRLGPAPGSLSWQIPVES